LSFKHFAADDGTPVTILIVKATREYVANRLGKELTNNKTYILNDFKGLPTNYTYILTNNKMKICILDLNDLLKNGYGRKGRKRLSSLIQEMEDKKIMPIGDYSEETQAGREYERERQTEHDRRRSHVNISTWKSLTPYQATTNLTLEKALSSDAKQQLCIKTISIHNYSQMQGLKINLEVGDPTVIIIIRITPIASKDPDATMKLPNELYHSPEIRNNYSIFRLGEEGILVVSKNVQTQQI